MAKRSDLSVAGKKADRLNKKLPVAEEAQPETGDAEFLAQVAREKARLEPVTPPSPQMVLPIRRELIVAFIERLYPDYANYLSAAIDAVRQAKEQNYKGEVARRVAHRLYADATKRDTAPSRLKSRYEALLLDAVYVYLFP